MPFRALIEGGHLRADQFSVIGLGQFSNSKEHIEYLTSRGTTLVTAQDILDETTIIDREFIQVFSYEDVNAIDRFMPGFVSFDLDVIDGAHAPGVSAVNPMGLRPEHALAIARAAGHHPGVRHLDVMELSPPNDDPSWNDKTRVPGRTARLAALIVLEFLSALRGRVIT